MPTLRKEDEPDVEAGPPDLPPRRVRCAPGPCRVYPARAAPRTAADRHADPAPHADRYRDPGLDRGPESPGLAHRRAAPHPGLDAGPRVTGRGRTPLHQPGPCESG